MEHSGRGEHNHRPRIVGVTPIEGFDVFELEHVAFDESVFDLLVRPSDEHLIKVVGLFRQSQSEIYRRLEIHPLPIGFEENAEFLGAAQSKNRDQH